eukprot:11211101-Lingulodinium_polyedra.AAC.1
MAPSFWLLVGANDRDGAVLVRSTRPRERVARDREVAIVDPVHELEGAPEIGVLEDVPAHVSVRHLDN